MCTWGRGWWLTRQRAMLLQAVHAHVCGPLILAVHPLLVSQLSSLHYLQLPPPHLWLPSISPDAP